MIRIHKPETPPATLVSNGKRATAQHRKAFTADRNGHRNGSKKIEFDRGIYAADDVKRALRTAQHDKCAFCEAKITHISPGDIEHFRPKRAVQQTKGEPLEFPGYFWLAYDWGNLLLSCSNCNNRHKGNLFPLADPSTRCRSPRGKLSNEQPLFINPAEEDPEPHIEFIGEMIRARNESIRGTVTITELGLDRTELVEHRLTLLRTLETLLIAVQKLQAAGQSTSEIEEYFEERQLPSAEYSAMAKAFLAWRNAP